jgi:ABC-2 type transport system ATP-binding protein
MMVGLLAPSGGLIRVAGFDVPAQRQLVKERVGYVPDRPTVYAWMRVGEAVAFTKSFYPRWNDARCKSLLDLFELHDDAKVKHLSKGTAAKLSLLLAICHEPEVLILDEPTSGMDPLVREEFLGGVLRVTTDREQTVLFSSHTLSDVQRLADEVALMHEGRLLLHGRLDTLLESTKRIRAVLAEPLAPREAPAGVIWQQLAGREWTLTLSEFAPEQVEFLRQKNRIEHLDVFDLSLDDFFKDFVRGRKTEVPA